MAAVFNDGSNTIKRVVELSEGAFDATARTDEWYDIDATFKVIKDGAYKRIALQFPDWLLSDAPRVVAAITSRDPAWFSNDGGHATIFVLGDTSYGSCCVDEVAAEHYNADFVVHYGHACLSRTSTKPVYFVFGKSHVDTGKLIASLDDVVGADAGARPEHPLLVVCHVAYNHAAATIARAVLGARPHARIAKLPDEGRFFSPGTAAARRHPDGHACILGQSLDLSAVEKEATVLYLGSDLAQRSQIALRFSQYPVYYFDGERCVKESINTNRILSRRYLMVSKLKDASMVGFLVGTMGVEGYNEILDHLEKIAEEAGIATYTFLMGKINAAKLANFPDIDAFVMIACPEHTLVDSKDFYRPVATPVEFEIALGLQEWNVSYSTHFDELRVHKGSAEGETPPTAPYDDTPHFSLATGGLVSRRAPRPSGEDDQDESDTGEGTTSQALVDASKKPSQVALRYSSPAADLLAQRSFRGLDPRIGKSEVHAATMGHVGRAAGYAKLKEALDRIDGSDDAAQT